MNDQLAIVTGTSSGIGLALARHFLQSGWRVVGTARRDSPIEAEEYRHHRADLGDPEALKEFMNQAILPALRDRNPERVALVNNAALMGALGWVRDSDPERLDTMFAVNVTAPIVLMGWMTKQVEADIPLRIVNISSGAAHNAYPGLGDYCATKAALRIAGQTLAGELEQEERSPRSVALLSFEPGLVETDMQRAARATSPEEFPGHDTFVQFAEEDMLHEPEEVVGAIVEWCGSDPDEHFSEMRFGE